jgi:hypothetical protein
MKHSWDRRCGNQSRCASYERREIVAAHVLEGWGERALHCIVYIWDWTHEHLARRVKRESDSVLGWRGCFGLIWTGI